MSVTRGGSGGVWPLGASAPPGGGSDATPALDSSDPFTLYDWVLLGLTAGGFGSAFLFISVALRSYSPGVIALGRIGFGILALVVLPGARKPVAKGDRPLIALLGIIWFGVPMLLYPIAQRTVASSIAGMLTGSMPVFTVVVGILWHRQLPDRPTLIGVIVGFAGILAISLPNVVGAGATPLGVSLILIAVFLYAVSVNIAAPLQRRNGALPVMLRVLLVSGVILLPVGLLGLADADPSPGPTASILVLGILATGVAPVAITTLVGRTGPDRGSVSVYFIPVVAAFLGFVVLGEPIQPAAVVGTGLVILGAYLASRGQVHEPHSRAMPLKE